MECKLIIGIDVSKSTLDLHIKPLGKSLQISNDLAGFKVLEQQIGNESEALVILEYTGSYSSRLELFLQQRGIAFCKVAALEIKRSIGIARGKSDQVDAMRIAEYGWLRREKLTPSKIMPKTLEQLNNLLSLRSKMVRDRSGYLTRLKELENAVTGKIDAYLFKTHRDVIKMFNKQIEMIEHQIENLIKNDANYLKTFQLLTSIKGVGRITAAKMIASTHNFKKFSNARKFNCYAGLAPFKTESGTSIKGRSRVSHLASKEIKTILNLSAFCAIRCDMELKQYYQRRVAEGKPKMACINIIRSKIVARMFAVVKKQLPYQPIINVA